MDKENSLNQHLDKKYKNFIAFLSDSQEEMQRRKKISDDDFINSEKGLVSLIITLSTGFIAIIGISNIGDSVSIRVVLILMILVILISLLYFYILRYLSILRFGYYQDIIDALDSLKKKMMSELVGKLNYKTVEKNFNFHENDINLLKETSYSKAKRVRFIEDTRSLLFYNIFFIFFWGLVIFVYDKFFHSGIELIFSLFITCLFITNLIGVVLSYLNLENKKF